MKPSNSCYGVRWPTDASSGIEVEGLVREFKNGPRAVDGIDLAVAPGEIYGFLGPNGAGKSTTVLMLTTLLPPTAGRARVGGFDVVSEGPRVRGVIGAALQEAALDPLLTGTEHMRLQTALHGLPKAERRARGDELLRRVGLSEAADRKVGGYSGGMKRRLDLALALVHRPRILFLDEPTTGLDIQSRTALWDEVARLAAEDGVTVFLTTQYLEEADALADRVGDHRPRPNRRGGDADRPEGGDRPPHGRGDPARPRRPRAPSAQVLASLRRAGTGGAEGRLGAALRRRFRARRRRARARREGPRDRASAAARPLPRRRLPRQDGPLAGGRRATSGEPSREARAGPGAGLNSGAPHPGRPARAPLRAAHPAPAGAGRAGSDLPALPARGELGRARGRDQHPRLPRPTPTSPSRWPIPFMQGALFSVMNAGTDLARDVETGFLNRLALTPLRGAALLTGLLAGRCCARRRCRRSTYLIVGLTAGADLAAGAGGVLVIFALSVLSRSASARSASSWPCAPARARRCRGCFPSSSSFSSSPRWRCRAT